MYDKLLNCNYTIKDDVITCLEQHMTLWILELKDNNITLATPISDFRKILLNNATLRTEYTRITNEAFAREYEFTPDYCIKSIMEHNEMEHLIMYGTYQCIVFTYNLKENELVASLTYDTIFDNDNNISLYIYEIFSNPNYRRQGYCYNILNILQINKLKSFDKFTLVCYISVWNTASMELFKKSGFTIDSVDLYDDITQTIDEKQMKYVCDYEGKKLHEANYFVLSKFVSHINNDSNNDSNNDLDNNSNNNIYNIGIIMIITILMILIIILLIIL